MARAFASIKRARTVVSLPECRYGCGKMLMTGDGYMCPICGWFMSYPKQVRA